MAISVEFQKRILELVEEQELTRTIISSKIGITTGVLSKALNYGIIPRTNTLIKIADYFVVSIEYLLGRTNIDNFIALTNASSFFIRIEELRESLNITYYGISIKLHFPDNYFTDWKKNGHLPSLDFLILFADFFKVSIDYLLGRTDDKLILEI